MPNFRTVNILDILSYCTLIIAKKDDMSHYLLTCMYIYNFVDVGLKIQLGHCPICM